MTKLMADRTLANAIAATAAATVKVRQDGGGIYQAWQRLYWDDPAGFARDCLVWADDQGCVDYQLDVLGSLVKHHRVAVRGPHGLGKTALASWVILWFALTRDGIADWKVATTASAWRQLVQYLWPEVHKWTRRVRWARVGRAPLDGGSELLTLQIQGSTGQAFALASDRPDYLEGAHADQLLYILDEAKAVPDPTWDAIEGAFSTGDQSGLFALAISTPGDTAGRFYDIHQRRPGYTDWTAVHVTLQQAIKAGRISKQWAAARLAQWGEGSAVYQQRVLGNFATDLGTGVIPLAWVEAANQRWADWQDSGDTDQPITHLGVDIADQGADDTVFALRAGNVITELKRWHGQDTMGTAGQAKILMDQHGCGAIVDVIGIGAGVVSRLIEQGLDVTPFNAAAGSADTDKAGLMGFVNQRSAAWWHLRELLDPSDPSDLIALPPDDLLTGDLTAPMWRLTSGGKIQLESKDDIRKRLGRSTDAGDSVVMAFAGGGDGVYFA